MFQAFRAACLLVVMPPAVHAADDRPPAAETVLLGGRILTVDEHNSVAQALAIHGGRIFAVGTDAEIQQHVGPATRIIALEGRTAIPGLIAAHCHAVGVARAALDGSHAELLSIAEVQEWIRRRAREIPAGQWIVVPRSDITRLKERRHPTPAELDAACTSHPVLFTAARKHALNSVGFRTAGATRPAPEIPGGEIIRDQDGNPRLIAGGDAHLRSLMPRPNHSQDEVLQSLRNVHHHYNAVGITSIFERAGGLEEFALYRQLRDDRELTVRMTQTFRRGFRSAADVEEYSRQLGLTTGDGDHWVRVGPIKIMVDGGIHWGNTHLREPYGKRRIEFYVHQDPNYRGDLHYSVEQMTELFAAGHRLGWQWCCHVTGDAGVDAVLDALANVRDRHPDIARRRFSLTHAYFPVRDSIARAKELGVCVDTQPSLYFKDSAAIDEIYGSHWAERFIGLGDWLRGGIPTAIAGDHMLGLDPNTAMNAYNPFLMLYVAVTRKDRHGEVRGARQKVGRIEALRCMTNHAAYLEFTEEHKGSLEAGKLADLAVLDRDYLRCPEEEIRDIQVRLTMIDGRIVYDADQVDD